MLMRHNFLPSTPYNHITVIMLEPYYIVQDGAFQGDLSAASFRPRCRRRLECWRCLPPASRPSSPPATGRVVTGCVRQGEGSAWHRQSGRARWGVRDAVLKGVVDKASDRRFVPTTSSTRGPQSPHHVHSSGRICRPLLRPASKRHIGRPHAPSPNGRASCPNFSTLAG